MGISNIIGGSNIYPCAESPLKDQNFVSHIEDYGYIQKINKMQLLSANNINLTKKQLELLEIEMRCVYSKNDPCWGYINGQGIRSRCIEERCPSIKKCNPTFSIEQRQNWMMSEETKSQYGYPEKQQKYYLVDLVSDEEMTRYKSDSKDIGKKYPFIKEQKPVKKEEPKGRRRVIIGFENTYFGDADDQFSPIWGYVDDSEDTGQMAKSRYGSTVTYRPQDNKNKKKKEKKTCELVSQTVTEEKEKIVDKASQEKRENYEKTVREKISKSYKLTELNSEMVAKLSEFGKISIILSNEAELAYVSSMLLQISVVHDIELVSGNAAICLWEKNIKKSDLCGNVFVSSEFVRLGYDEDKHDLWENLQQIDEAYELAVTGREFFEFSTSMGKRWGCRNLYGATHIVLKAEDFNIGENILEGVDVLLKKGIGEYEILSAKSGEILGTTTDKFLEVLKSLKELDEISDFPINISGLVLDNSEYGLEIKGIGHMKFDEY